jgi:hypothetical protein
MKKTSIVTALLLAVLMASGTGGCAPRTTTTRPAPAPVEQTETAVPATSSPEHSNTLKQVTARLYFVRGEKIGVAGRDLPALPAGTDRWHQSYAAVAALLEGPTAQEREFGLGTTIPAGTRLNGVSVTGGTATVDLSRQFESGGGSLSMLLRVTQVVCTLTQYPDIKRVAFRLDGKPVAAIGGEGIIVSPPVGRADFEGQLPAILVESPVPGQTIASPVTIWGSSNVFEAVHQVNITDPDGLIIAEKTVTATSGTGTRGTWKISLSYPTVKRPGLGEVIVFENSAKDGKPINIVEIPVYMTK